MEDVRDLGPGVIGRRDGITAWADTCVPFCTTTVEGMPDELAGYVGLAVEILQSLQPGDGVNVSVEPDWDGCDGRWLTLEVSASLWWKVRLCSCALTEPDRAAGWLHPPNLERAIAVLSAQRWGYVDDDWEILLPADPHLVARLALLPALALFDVYDPRRWFVSLDLISQDLASVDLRAWRRGQGLPPPPPTIAPAGTEPWSILCEFGLHDRHAPPCWDAAGRRCE